MNNKKRMLMAAVLALPLFTIGCGDSIYKGIENKNSTEAKSFDAAQRLDKGNYDSILADPDSVNALDYTAAALGKMGYETTTLVDAMNQAGDSTATETDISTILNISTNPDNLDYLETAKTKLETELASDPNNQELNLQRSILGYTKITGSIAKVGNGQTLTTASVKPGVFTVMASVTVDATDGLSLQEIKAIGKYLVDNAGADPANSDYTGGSLLEINIQGSAVKLIKVIADEAYKLVYANNGGTISKSGLGDGSVKKNIQKALSNSSGVLGGYDLSNYDWSTITGNDKFQLQYKIGNYLKNRS